MNDGDEDANRDGKLDPGETNPMRSDSDCDGYSDKEERNMAAGCATDPLKKDTDGDGLQDGVEGGLTGPGNDPANCMYAAGTFDTDPASKTNACNADSDGDGIQDGAEDGNLNGKVDPGELDPNNGGDASGPATQACSTANLRPVTFSGNGVTDVQVALPNDFTELNHLLSGSTEAGFVFYDANTKVAGIAFSKAPSGGDGSAEEAADRSKIGAVSNPLLQTFTTWDGFAGSVRATYDLPGTGDVKDTINTIAKNFLGGTLTGTLAGSAGATGPFKVQAEFVRRTNTRAVVVIALVPAANYSGQSLFRIDDTSNGTALAQYSDFAGTQCEVFDALVSQKVDFLWVVDDSQSMSSSQAAVGAAGSLFGMKLANAGLDWRVGGVSTGYYKYCTIFGNCKWDGSYRDWTSDVAVMNTWFTVGNGAWFGIGGSSDEEGFAGAQAYLNLDGPGPGKPQPFRTGAALHFIFMSDTKDQSGLSPQDVRNLVSSKYPGQQFMSHGIVCPEGQDCGDSNEDRVGKYHTLIRQTGGVLGDINTFKPTSPTPAQQAQQSALIDAILSAAIGGTGHQLQRPPISSTIKIAVASTKGACNTADVPRDRTNGWDLDAASRRIVFYGNCIPSSSGVKVAVSYKYWNDNSTDPNGDACGATCMAPEVCDPSTKQCVCPSNCGGCAGGLVCNTVTCACEPGIN